MDVGTGDGRRVLRAARRDPANLYIGIDTNATALKHSAQTAARKPTRGGASNARFVVGSFEELPGPFAGRATSVTVYLPWGSLLASALSADGARRLRSIGSEGTTLDVVVSFDARRDAKEWARLGIDAACLDDGRVARTYALAGWQNPRCREIQAAELAEIGTTWAKKLAFARGRRTWRLTATC